MVLAMQRAISGQSFTQPDFAGISSVQQGISPIEVEASIPISECSIAAIESEASAIEIAGFVTGPITKPIMASADRSRRMVKTKGMDLG